jgi:hypothetical protein
MCAICHSQHLLYEIGRRRSRTLLWIALISQPMRKNLLDNAPPTGFLYLNQSAPKFTLLQFL